MRVMFAITKGEVGGAQEHVRILAQGLIERGNPVALVVTPESDLAESVGSMGVEILPWRSISAGASPVSNLSARRQLKKLVKDWGPDVLHLHSSVAGAVGSGLLRSPKGVTIFTCHHAAFGKGRKWSHRILARPVAKATLPRMDGIISVGTRDMKALHGIAKEVPLALVRNAVPAATDPITDGELRPSAIWVARLASPKDPLMAVAAWEKVVEQVPEATLTICGTGPLAEQLRAQVAVSAARNNIEVAGFVPDVTPVIKRSSAFLLVSKVEGGITMATLEAMGQGLVPVVTDAGDSRLLAEQNCGIVVDSYDPDSIAESLVALFSDPDRYAKLRSNALAFVSGRTVDDFVEETIDFYRLIADRAPSVGIR
ncbi:MAG: glycosyltransferase family 4 protein [Acidimicrobiales bacterium]